MSNVKKILFVDDEPKVLAGIQRQLRDRRDEWEMTFATSGPDALSRMDSESFDVVISDMKMPGMSGVEFLDAVRVKHPRTVRIILSGQSDQAQIERSTCVAHQYLTKPCDRDVLRATVARACSLRDRMYGKRLFDIVSQISTLPSLPTVYAELQQELAGDDPSLARIGDIIASDIAMTTKLLQIVNSSFFGLAKEVENARQAAAYLGVRVLRPLALTSAVFSQFAAFDLDGYTIESLTLHSMAVSSVAERIVADLGGDQRVRRHAMLAGAVHDVGQLILAQHRTEDFRRAVHNARESGRPLYLVEREILGSDHAALGAYLLGLWGFADTIVDAVALHHEPGSSWNEGLSTRLALSLADAIVSQQSVDVLTVVDAGVAPEMLVSGEASRRLAEWRDLASQQVRGEGQHAACTLR